MNLNQQQQKDESQGAFIKSSKIVPITEGVIFLMILIIAYFSFRFFQSWHNQQKKTTLQHMSVMVDLVSEDIAVNLNQVKHSLRLLSRMKVFRKSRLSGIMFSVCQKLEENYEKWVENTENSCKEFLPLVFSRFEEFAELEKVITSPEDLQIATNTQNGSTPELLILPKVNIPIYISLMRDALECYSKDSFGALKVTAILFDTAFHTGVYVVSDFWGAEDALRASLSDTDIICSIILRTLDGSLSTYVTEIGQQPSFLFGKIDLSENMSKPFYPGRVFFAEGLGRPLWQAAVPLLEQDRRPFGILSSQVDLAFLSKLAEKVHFSPGAQLFVVDEEGTVIGHSKKQIVINQVNMAHSNPAFVEVMNGRDGDRQVEIARVNYLTAYRSLKNIDQSNLPHWGIMLIIPLSEVFAGEWAVTFGVFALAVMGIFILWYLSDFVLSNLEENEA